MKKSRIISLVEKSYPDSFKEDKLEVYIYSTPEYQWREEGWEILLSSTKDDRLNFFVNKLGKVFHFNWRTKVDLKTLTEIQREYYDPKTGEVLWVSK